MLLSDVRVLEVGHGLAGAVAGMTLGDLGADVVRIEAPHGDPCRKLPAYQTWNRNKRVAHLDIREPAGIERMRRLIDETDIFINSTRAIREIPELAPGRLLAQRPRLVVCSIVPFPLESEFEDLPGWDELVAAVSGFFDHGIERAPYRPVFVPLPVASTYAGLISAFGATTALHQRDRTGKGDSILVSLEMALLQAQRFRLLHTNAALATRNTAIPRLNTQFQCSDGRWLQLVPHFPHLATILSILGLERFFEEEDDSAELDLEALAEAMAGAFKTRTAEEWEQSLSDAGACAAVCRTIEEWLVNPHAHEAGLIVNVDTPLGPMKQPGPLLEGLQETVLAPEIIELGDEEPWRSPPLEPKTHQQEPNAAPLAGVRILDFSLILAGPTCGRLLAELGADVIKLDCNETLPGQSAWLDTNAGKRSILLDLKSPDGLSVLWKLIGTADVILENFSVGVTSRLGFDYETVFARFPQIVYASVNCYGHKGLYAARHGWEHTAQAVSGVQVRYGGRNQKPELLAFPLSDYSSAYVAATGIVAALRERELTGIGRRIQTSLVAATGLMQALYLFDLPGYERHEVEGLDAIGFDDASRMFQCADGWIFLRLGDSSWPSVFAALQIDVPNERSYPLNNPPGRKVTEILEQELAGLEISSVIRRLSEAAISAAPVRRIQDVLDDPGVRAVGLIRSKADANFGVMDQAGRPFDASWTSITDHTSIPTPGQHTVEILQELGLGSAEIECLLRDERVFSAAR